jgi:hypothetical protein
LSSRLGIASGLVRPDDYQGDLEDLVRERFPSRRAFCEASGLSEEALRDLLAGREGLSLGALTRALERVGYRLRITPAPIPKAAAKKQPG